MGAPGSAWRRRSQFLENYAWQPDVLQRISSHVETGASLPQQLQQRLIQTRSFQAGLQVVRQLEFSLFDFKLHAGYDPRLGGRIAEVLAEVRAAVAVTPVPQWNRFAHSFGHVFAGGHAAGYYSYKRA